MGDDRMGERTERLMRVNLGCSDALHPDFLNVDIWTPPGAPAFEPAPIHSVAAANAFPSVWQGRFLKADLRKRWPFEDSSLEAIRAHDIIEHLPNRVHTMNEAFRVLAPGGAFDIFVPTTDGRGAWQDPTHVSFWNANSFLYFCEEFAEWQRFHEAYGISARFRLPGSQGNANEGVKLLEAAMRTYGGNVAKIAIVLECVK